jgi:hypothetical protein
MSYPLITELPDTYAEFLGVLESFVPRVSNGRETLWTINSLEFANPYSNVLYKIERRYYPAPKTTSWTVGISAFPEDKILHHSSGGHGGILFDEWCKLCVAP